MSAAVSSGVEVYGVSKSFGSIKALREVNLEVEGGTVFGLLGPNGAGKTTLVRVLTTLLAPDSGSARIAGFDVVREASALRSVIGLAGQYAAVDETLTGRENLELVGRLYHLPRKEAKKRAGEVLERFGLTEAAGRVVKGYSGGMRRRLDLGASLVGRPRILFLDEPTTGLDPASRNGLWEVIEELAADGTTVLLTTQYLEEAERLAEQMAVIDQGTVIARGTSAELKGRYGGERLEVRLARDEETADAARALAPIGEGDPRVVEGEALIRLPVHKQPGLMSRAVRALDSADIEADDLYFRQPTLDDVFLALTGKAAEEDEVEGSQDEEYARPGAKLEEARKP